jgi:hypothetical protein
LCNAETSEQVREWKFLLVASLGSQQKRIVYGRCNFMIQCLWKADNYRQPRSYKRYRTSNVYCHFYKNPPLELILSYWVFRAQADWTFILPSELLTKELLHLPRKMPPQAYRTSQCVVPRGGIFLGKWRSSFVGSSDGKMNVQSACALSTL